VRALALLACLPAVVGAWLLVDADDIGPAMAWLLLPAVAAGVILSQRFYPLRLTSRDTERMNALWKRTFADVGWIALGYLVVLFASAIATQVVDPDVTVFAVNPFIAFLAGAAALLGVVGGFITVLPVVTLVVTLARLVAGKTPDAGQTAAATLLLSVAVFATSLVLATAIDTGGSPRGEAWTAIFVLVTGIESEEARIVSQPLAWVARVALAAIVGSIVWLAAIARREKRGLAAEG
jgi:hypothetical protein